MILTKRAILARIESGHVISPPELVQENSVNVRLGREMWEPDDPEGVPIDLHQPRKFRLVEPVMRSSIEDPPMMAGVADHWVHALKVETFYLATTMDAHGSILLGDGVGILPDMRARSTTGRHGLTVALCAGFGDVGYAGRWALEIVNLNKRPIFLAVGTEIAQVVFHEATAKRFGGAE